MEIVLRLPEMLHEMAVDEDAYRALLAIPAFARTLNVSIRADYMVKFGYTVKITNDKIVWKKHGRRHREAGPAVIRENGPQE